MKEQEDAEVEAPASLSLRRGLFEYGSASVLSVIAAVFFLELWRADLRVPFDYHDDALYFEMLVKSVVDHGWFLTNPLLGAPDVLTMHDFPSADAFHMLTIRVMSLVSSDWALLFNVYFLLGFPLITVSALAVFRHFRIPYGPALVGSVLFAFLPRRLLQGEIHYTLDMFYQVPLAILVALWVCGKDPPLFARDARERRNRLDLRRSRSIAAILICAMTSATGIYYAFFAGLLVLLGGVWASFELRTPRNALSGLMLVGTIIAGLSFQAIPHLVYHRRHGPNPEVAAHQPQESEAFGMRLAQLLLPVPGHRVPLLRQIRRRYDAQAPFPGESSTEALGTVGTIGFLTLLGVALVTVRRERPRAKLLGALAVLNLIAILVATTGGFGSLFAFLVTPQLRAYMRMHVFIAFFALFAVVLLLERAQSRSARLAAILLPLVLVLGLLDQVTPRAVRPYATIKGEYAADAAFVRQIQAAVPAHASILELPYQPFPEAPAGASGRQIRYEPIRPYLHSPSLRWSYPAMRGRSADAWARNLAERPPAKMLQGVTDAGFDGIVIDRRGYDDNGAEIQRTLEQQLGKPPANDAAGRLMFFGLTEHNGRALSDEPPGQRAWRRDIEVHPLFIRWVDGFYNAEQGPGGPFRWCSRSGTIEIDNDSRAFRRAVISMTIIAGAPSSVLRIAGDLMSEQIEITSGGTHVSRSLGFSPGRHVIRFRSDGPPADVPSDPRDLIWRAESVALEESAPP